MQTSDVELGFLAHPDEGPVPGVVMIHDVWGLSDHTRDLARRLAVEGFAVLAVDLYRREGEVSISDPGRWMRELPDPRVLEDVQAGIDFLRDHPAVRPAARPAARPGAQERGVGITGFCMGGQYVLLAACSCQGLQAAVAFYGLLSYEHGVLAPPEGERLDPERKPRSPLDAIADLRCPLLGLFGEDDSHVPVSDVRELERRLEAAGKKAEIRVYLGAGHAFMNDTRPDAYRPEIARLAWDRLVAFLRGQLS